MLKENSVDYRTEGTIKDDLFLIRICILVVFTEGSWFNGMKIYRLHWLCNVYVLFFIFCFRVVFLGAATVLIFFLNALVLCFYLEHVQRITFCRCFLIFNQAVFCVDDGIVLWLKIKKSYSYS